MRQGHIQLRAGTLAAANEGKIQGRGDVCLCSSPPGPALTWGCSTRTPDPKSGSDPQHSPQHCPTEPPGTAPLPNQACGFQPEAGAAPGGGRGGEVTAPPRTSPPCPRRGHQRPGAGAGNAQSITRCTPSPSPQNQTHTQKQKGTAQEKPGSSSTAIPGSPIPRRRLLCPLPHPSLHQSPSVIPGQVPWASPQGHSLISFRAHPSWHFSPQPVPDFSLLSQCTWKYMTTSAD